MADDTTPGDGAPETNPTDPTEGVQPEASEPEGADDEQSAEAAAALAAAQAAMAGLSASAKPAQPEPAANGPSAGARLGAHSPRTEGDVRSFSPPAFDIASTTPEPMPAGIELLSDVDMGVKIELGRANMLVEDVLKLSEGCVIELDKLAGDPVDIFVNGRHIARGEVLVLNDNFCVRVSEILAASDDNGRRAG